MESSPKDDNSPRGDPDASLSHSVDSLLASVRASPGREREDVASDGRLADDKVGSTGHIPPLPNLSSDSIAALEAIQHNGDGQYNAAAAPEASHKSKHNRTLSCCCGQDDCAFQKRGEMELKSLENDVRAAATVGQALLVRHQTYAADAERDRFRMNNTIADLERRNKELETLNAQLVEENKALLEQVEGLNNAITDSDAQIKSITATLHSTQHELHKFSVLASRADNLEEQVRQMEAEQGNLHATLTITEKERKDAMQKWRTSQRRVTMLQDQLDTIDHEATEERRRHAEVVERMARRRAMELELDPVSGIKNELSKSSAHQKKGSETVSSFVKQILHDNSNMELSMVELQQLLTSSQNEVENLRDKLLEAHLATGAGGGGGGIFNGNQLTPNLETELDDVESPFHSNQHQESPKLSQEVHVHHHFHGSAKQSPVAGRSRSVQLFQRPARRKRLGSTGGRSTPISSTERDSHRSRSSLGILTTDDLHSPTLSQSVDRSNRWSLNSGSSHRRANSLSVISSAPSSPPSMSAHSAIFERGFGDDDRTDYSSRPTSPESNAGPFWSPMVKPTKHRKDISRDSVSQQFLLPSAARSTTLGIPSLTTTRIDEHDVIPEQESEDPPSPRHKAGRGETQNSQVSTSPRRSTLRKSASNSSLTISGMDIHSTLPTPTRLLPRQPSLGSYGKTGVAALTASTALSHQHASASRSQKVYRNGGASSTVNTGSASAWRMLRGKLESSAATTSTETKTKSYSPFLDTLGGWFSGNKTGTSSPSTTEATTPTAADGAKSPADSISVKSGNEPIAAQPIPTPQKRPNLSPSISDPIASLAGSGPNKSPIPRSLPTFSPAKRIPIVRSSGVNQAGGLPLYPPGMRHSGRVRIVKKADEEALLESLLEEASPSASMTSSPQLQQQQQRQQQVYSESHTTSIPSQSES